MSSEEFDKAVETKVPDKYRPVMDALRELMREGAPQAAETTLYGSPAWKGNKALAIVSVSKTHLTFAFERGAEFDDPHGLLEGVGKKTRHVKLKTLDGLNRDALRDYIAQAVTLDAE
ncbi:hypothetical protein SAMN04489712_110190 [Thermomonospora echinospora]|uniref:YdhG-like domain-containing protein n=1 Tax=Thermomonospora echinospora TaxID=1992 RepID=A0A1H6CM34_9ACTN|nr:DUF1801 domain-containing protein [Thermomonospora echinospora]SEG74109.1 hypothetical protein SAMN04489712_110190 [Thermomonospora echinospora]